jgi:ubiquinone/menaquinone biosynthesis C-methylase UbiE
MSNRQTLHRMSVVERMIQRSIRGHGPQQEVGFVGRVLLRMFGRPRGVFGKVGGYVMARTNRVMNEWVIQVLAVQPQEQVLEIGFGPGIGIQLLSHKLTTGRVSGIDPSEEMVTQARARNLAAIQAGRVDLRRGSVEHLPYPDAIFDKAMTMNSLQVWPDPVGGLRESRRVLKDGGKLAVCFTSPALQPGEPLPELLQAADFMDITLEEQAGAICAIAVKR